MEHSAIDQQSLSTNEGPIESNASQVLLEKLPGIIKLLSQVAKESGTAEVDRKRLRSSARSLQLVGHGLQRKAIEAF